MSDVDFRDITIAGAHGTLSGTRLGDCKGNTNITFDAAKTVYYRQTGSADWGATGSGSWSATSGGALDATMFPLAQDTAVFPAATYPASGSTTTINASYNFTTIDMSLRTSDTMTLATGSTAPFIYGDWINGTGITLSGTSSLVFAGRTTQTITSAGRSFTQNIVINSPSGSVTLQDALTTGSSATIGLTTGTLDLNNFTFSAGFFSSNNTSTRTIAFGTGNITLANLGTVWTTATTTGLTTTGTQVVNITYGGSGPVTVNPGLLSEANSISFNFLAGSYSLKLFEGGNVSVRNLNFAGTPGYSGTLEAVTANSIIYGNLTLSAGMGLTSTTNTLTFAATSGTKTISTAAKTLDFPVTFSGVGGTWQLQAAMTVGATRTTTLANGTLDLNSFALSSGIFSSNNANTRAIAFGATGSIVATTTTSGVTVLNMATATNFTFTGTSNISAAMSVTRTFNFGGTAGATTSNRLNVNTTSGAQPPTFTGSFRQINFTGSTSVYTSTVSCHGFTLAAGGGYGATFNLVGDGTLAYAGRSTAAVAINGSGITTTLASAGQNGQTVLINGTLDLAGYTLTNTTNIVTSAGTKNLTFNGGTVICSATSATAFNNAAPTGFTTTAGTGTGTISMTSASAKTFVGGGSTFNCTLRQGGLGALTITGSNTFDNITNTVQPASVLFTAGTTNTFLSGFSLSGTAGNLITIDSVTAASHTLSKASGTVSSSYLSITNSTATGGATWQAFTVNGNVDGGNNTGWIFAGVTYAAAIAETGTATDSVISFANFYAALAETATATDSPSVAASTFNAPVAETATATDAILGLAAFSSALSETATATDSVLGFSDLFVSLAETATATDSILGQAAFSSVLSETATATDSPSVAASTFNAPIAETATATDAILGLAAFNSALSETATATDSILGLAAFSSALAETATATDSVLGFSDLFVSLAETATATDSPLVAPSTFNAPVAETATATDSVLSQAAFNSVLSETATATDSPSVAASTFNAPVAETTTATDSVLSFADFYAALAETATATDSVLSFADFYAALAETATATDAVLSFADFYAALAETATATDSPLVAPSTFNAPVAETATATDAVSPPGSIYNAPVSETVTISDLVLALFLWNLIDDSQSVTWQNINSSPGTTWSPIDTDPDTGWSVTPTVN
jgi:hypothetical protein